MSTYPVEFKQLEEENKQLQAENKWRKENLKIYGHHHNSCKIPKEKTLNAQGAVSTSEAYCTCGFEQALQEKPK